MKSKTKQGLLRFQLKLMHYGNSYYIDRIADLERALARKPRQLQLDMVGEGEIQADWALLIRSILNQRSPKTRIITNARSSLQGGSVLVWLQGDRRIIRPDARVFFRRATESDDAAANENAAWKEGEPKYTDSYSETDPEEADYARVLQAINEFLPVKEMAGRPVEVAELRQFGLVENDKLDRFLATAIGKSQETNEDPANEPRAKRVRSKTKSSQTRRANK